jgi:hypothetical protein
VAKLVNTDGCRKSSLSSFQKRLFFGFFVDKKDTKNSLFMQIFTVFPCKISLVNRILRDVRIFLHQFYSHFSGSLSIITPKCDYFLNSVNFRDLKFKLFLIDKNNTLAKLE